MSNYKKIGIIVAMDLEYNLVCQLLEQPQEEQHGAFRFLCGHVGEKEIILSRCGIGKVNAACGTTELIRTYQPDAVVSTGVAGGIDAILKVMDVVVSREVVYHDVWCGEGNAYGQVQGLPERFAANPNLLAKALSLTEKENAPHIVPGLICSGDKFITDRSELNTIKTAFPEGLAVDMESGAIAQTCHLHNIPFLSFRVISDTPGVEEHWNQYTNFWDTVAECSFSAIHQFITSL